MMRKGTAKRFNDAKRIGSITPDGGGEFLFTNFFAVHGGGFKSLHESQKVSLNVKPGPKGKQAANIQPLQEHA
jgi:CspA family cold shock protein